MQKCWDYVTGEYVAFFKKVTNTCHLHCPRIISPIPLVLNVTYILGNPSSAQAFNPNTTLIFKYPPKYFVSLSSEIELL